VAVVGEIPPGLPGLEVPNLMLTDTLALLPAALGIFFVSFSDHILTARTFAGRHGQHVRVNTELAAMGAANLAAGITQAFPVGASGSRTAVNDQMGGRTQRSGLIGAAAIAVVLLFLTEPMRYLPKATLGAVIVAAAIGLVYRLDDRLFFANASYVKGRVREAIHGAPTPVEWFVFDAEGLTHVDATGVDALTELIRSLRTDQITFVFARLKGPMRQDLREAGVLDLVGEAHLYPTVQAAVQAAPAVRSRSIGADRPCTTPPPWRRHSPPTNRRGRPDAARLTR
jgi:MFS superfamily sulfate permease-like transporter